jgi:inner membrane protein
LWNANVETQDSYLLGDYSFFDSVPIRFVAYPKNREASEDLLAYTNVQRLITIAEGWYILEQKSGHWYFNDLRFGLIPRKDGEPYFAFSYQLKPENGQIIAEEVSRTRGDAEYLVTSLWERIQGRH